MTNVRLFRKLQKHLDYLTYPQIEAIEKAFLFADAAHKEQKRQSGEPYITHPVAVAGILADMHMDHQSIIAALLHDVIEDQGVSKERIAQEYGKEVADIVDGVSKLTQMEFSTRAEAQAENFRKMVLAMARDIRVILVKLADRLHNMRTLEPLSPEKRRRVAKETLEIFAPIAKRLGMREMSSELEDIGFKALYPMRYKALCEAMHKARGHRKGIINEIHKTLENAFKKSGVSVISLVGREKRPYSVYRKMRDKHIPFSQIMDVYGFRIIVDSNDDSYRALGIVHSAYKPMADRFKDYIAIPKANGYQSLHTTLFGPYGVPIEVQIRTQEMEEYALSGIAAHWLYKSRDKYFNKSQIRAEQWVKSLLEMQQKTGNSLEFIENVKIDLFPEEVYVFTPKGGILELQAGSTPVDFAYAVHTEIGNSCVAAKIDKQLVPLSTPLSNGQTVEVITAKDARPNPAWLNFVVTGKARTAIRHYLRSQRRSESIKLGKDLLKKALASRGINLRKLSDDIVSRVVQEANFIV